MRVTLVVIGLSLCMAGTAAGQAVVRDSGRALHGSMQPPHDAGRAAAGSMRQPVLARPERRATEALAAPRGRAGIASSARSEHVPRAAAPVRRGSVINHPQHRGAARGRSPVETALHHRGPPSHAAAHAWRHDRRYRSPRRYHAPERYVYPTGPRIGYWHVGARLPPRYYHPRYHVDYRYYGLPRPPRGHHWVRIDHDVVLVAIASGMVANVLFELFHY